ARAETDQVEILSGVFAGKATGTPIALLIMNRGHDPSAYDQIKDKFRPGHADLTYLLKYGIRDHRGGGRASGRETAARVAAGAVARAVLAPFNVSVRGATIQVGKIRATARDISEIEKNPLRCPDAKAAKKMLALVEAAKKAGDSVGGVVEVIAHGVPAGLGEPVFDKLDAMIAGALMSIGAVKGVEIGDGFAVAGRRGSQNSDPFELGGDGRVRSRNNRGGGILGGISTGEPIVARIAVKPTSSIAMEQDTIDIRGKKSGISVQGRHDPCLCPRIVPVAEAMMLLVICDQLLIQRARTGKPGPAGRVGKR
ncbi:MAG TPA: chorismate synthase, partial [bacterium]|nr:chorismate synthase [bacterium]